MTDGAGLTCRLIGALLGSALVVSGCSKPVPEASVYLTEIRDDWIVSEAEATAWHALKDENGPALTGNASWHEFVGFVERELAESGVVDIERNAWTFDRWQTSEWPDRSGWSLVSDGEAVDVASYGANSGSTGPDGVTADLLYYDRNDPPSDVRGKIVVFEIVVESGTIDAVGNADYEYLSHADSYPQPGRDVPEGLDNALSAKMFLQLLQVPSLIEVAVNGGAGGALFVLDAGRELAAGMYTFPVPAHYDVPSLYLDRTAGLTVIEHAKAGARATLRLEATVEESTAYQLIGYLPGRDYGTPADEQVQLVTHTDGPSISQDNGAFGILGIIRYMSQVPQAERPRTLMVYLDCRHFMPGMERAFASQDWFARNADARESIVGLVGVEHLGQIEYVEEGDALLASGRIYPTQIWASNNENLVRSAVEAVGDNELPSAYVRNVAVPGLNGRDQGRWYGMAKHAPSLGLPAFGMMGFMGAYWATSSGLERFDAGLFRTQVATLAQLAGLLMTADLDQIKPDS